MIRSKTLRSSVLGDTMTPLRRFTGFLNIEPGEERLIGLLVLLYFSLALGVVFVQSMAFGVFICRVWRAGSAVFLYRHCHFRILGGCALYQDRRAGFFFKTAFHQPDLFGRCTSLLIWLALNSPLYHVTAFILPLWFQTAINLGNLAVWPLAGSLFDFRQGKRLFPLLGAGNWLANIIGGLFIPALVKSVGATNLLVVGGVQFWRGTFYFAHHHAYLSATKNGRAKAAQRAPRPAKPQTGIFKDRYVLLIFAYTHALVGRLLSLWIISFLTAPSRNSPTQINSRLLLDDCSRSSASSR